jgi:triosephosphate isomerase
MGLVRSLQLLRFLMVGFFGLIFIKVVIAAPAIHLAALKSVIRPDVAVSAENVAFTRGYGAFTGEITAEMLKDSGINWTLTGHSERRVGFGYPVCIRHYSDSNIY